MRVTADLLGRPLDRIEFSSDNGAAARPVELAAMTVPPGTCAKISLRYDGYSGDENFISFEGYYYVGAEQRPADAAAAEYVVIEIEGRPSMRVTWVLKASLRDGLSATPQFGKFDRDARLRGLRFQGGTVDVDRNGIVK